MFCAENTVEYYDREKTEDGTATANLRYATQEQHVSKWNNAALTLRLRHLRSHVRCAEVRTAAAREQRQLRQHLLVRRRFF